MNIFEGAEQTLFYGNFLLEVILGSKLASIAFGYIIKYLKK